MLAIALVVAGSAGTAGAERAPRAHQELPATASTSQANNTPVVAADPTERRFVALANRVDAPDFSCALQLSGDGGRGWVPANPVPRERIPQGAEKCYGPEVAFDRKGRLYYLFAALAGNANVPVGVFLTTSDDRGRTFSPPRQVVGPNSFQARLAIDQAGGGRGRLHVVWLAANEAPGIGSLPPPPNPIMAIHSDDGGASFSAPVQVSDPARQRVVAPAVAIGADRALHVLYYDLERDAVDYHGLEGPTWEGTWSLVLATSVDRGKTFSRQRVVDAEVVPPQRVMLILTMPPPSVAVGRGGRVYAVWRDARSGDPDVWLRASADGGHSWGEPRRVNDDPAGTGRDQDLPRLAVSAGGRLDVVFYDRRDDPENLHNHVYYTVSHDNGRTFATNRRLTARASDSRIGQRYELLRSAAGLVEFGSRLALVSWDDRALVAWADTRYSTEPAQQDIMTTVLDWPDRERDSSAVLPLTFVAGTVVVLVLVVVRRRPVPRPWRSLRR